MKCKNTSGECDYSEKIKAIEGQGSFKGYDVFQCPKCKEVATTVKKSIKKADIKKGLPEGISPSSNPRTKAQMISENNSDEFRDYAKRENINPKESCPSCGIKATEGNEVAGFTCPNCDQQPKHHPSNFAYEDLGDNTGLPSRIDKFVKGKTHKDAPNYEKKIDRMGPEGGYKRQQGKQEVISASNRSVTDPVLGTVDRFQKTVPDKIKKFISKAEKNVFGDMDKREQAEFYVPGDPDNINYLGFEKHKKGEVSKSIKKSVVKKGRLGGIAGGALGTGVGYALGSKYGGEHGIPGGRKGRIGGAALGGALGTGLGSMAQDKLKNKDEDEEEKSLDKASDTPLYSIKKDNPDPDAAYGEMRERRPIKKPARNVGLTNKYENVKGGDNYAVEPDWDAMKDDVDVEKFKRPSKAAGAAIGAGLGALTPLGPLGAAGGAYLGHKLGKSSQGQKSVGGKKIKRLRAGHASSGPKVPMAPQHSRVKKAVPGWEVPTYNICPECKQDRPGDENVMRGMKCAACSGMGGVPELCGRIGNFVDKGRDFQTKGERREQTKRPRMPMSGRNTGEVYRNAVEKRAPKPSKKIIEKSNPRIYDNGGETIDRYTLIDRQNGMHGFNSEPYHPQGFGQFAGDFQGGSTKHLGKKVHISTLSPNAQKFVNERNGEAPKPSKKMGNINKAGAPILPCKSCGKQVPHFQSSPSTTKGLCSECIRTSLTKPNTVKKALWNTQKVCTDPKCGWKQPYDKNDKRHAVLHQAAACPQCKKPLNTEGFSPDF
jgi:predicted RNA-binding Zn-ribbon protein involved in translation (DUF1610 family)